MNKEEYEKLKIIKTVKGNEIVEEYYNPITCTMVSKADIDCYKYKQALLDIKNYIVNNSEKFEDMLVSGEFFEIKNILDIVNKALGDKE